MQLHFKRQKYSNNTINKFTEMVKMVYQFNAVNNFIDGNPIRDLKKLKKEIVETIIIPRKIKLEIFNWLNKLSNDNVFNLRDKIIIYLLNETGIRLNELVNLKTKNIDLETKLIHLILLIQKWKIGFILIIEKISGLKNIFMAQN